MNFLQHFESAIEPGVTLPAGEPQSMHRGRPLWARYDLDGVREVMTKSVLASRPRSMWRYRELLPIGDEIEPVSMQESFSPIIECRRLASFLGLQSLAIKDESQLPTCSFKCRGLSLAVTMARHFGMQRVAMASNGNAGGAMAAYAARAGIDSVVLLPADTPPVIQWECVNADALTFLTNGLIDENGKVVRQGHDRGLWYDISTLKEPYRLEGKKTMGLEIADQSAWQLPDVIVYPTGGGTALIAMWKAFKELREMGFLESETMPRMIACQSSGCSPIVTAFENGKRFAERVEHADTVAAGIRVPSALGDFMILDTVRESGGLALAADESRLAEWQQLVGRTEGLMICPEAATCVGGLLQLIDRGEVSRDDRILIVNTAAGQKYGRMDLSGLPQLDIHNAVDWDAINLELSRQNARCRQYSGPASENRPQKNSSVSN